MPWSTSNRRSRLPADWDKRRTAVRRRARDRCEAIEHAPGCTGWGAECDHVGDPDDHGLDNLQWLSVACHLAKTLRQARAAADARRARGRRPAEPPPGLVE